MGRGRSTIINETWKVKPRCKNELPGLLTSSGKWDRCNREPHPEGTMCEGRFYEWLHSPNYDIEQIYDKWKW